MSASADQDLVALGGYVDRPAIAGPHQLSLPPDSCVDPGYLFEVSTITNRAHAALGTELVLVAPDEGVVRLRWRPELGEADETWAPGVIASLADHVCSMTSVVALGDVAHFGGTMSLRVEYATPSPGEWLVARAAAAAPSSVLRLSGDIHAVQGTGAARRVRLVATMRCSVLDRRISR